MLEESQLSQPRRVDDIDHGVMQLGAHFPKPEGPEVIIDVSLFEERQLTAVSGDTYPLIIRLECVSDKGKTESHQLKVCRLILYTGVQSLACMLAMRRKSTYLA